MRIIALLAFTLWVSDKPHGCPVIHPLVHATKDVPTSMEMNDFMNGLVFSCPDGYHTVDVKHAARDNLTYKDMLNAVESMECQKDK